MKDPICELLGPPVTKYMIRLEDPKNTVLLVSEEVWEKLNKFVNSKMNYFQMADDLFKRYSTDPYNVNTDREVRNKANVPENRYYTVSMWPENLQGRVYVNTTMFRAVKTEKISKSSQT